MSKLPAIAASVILTVSLSACSQLDSGRVVDKEEVDDYTTRSCSGSGKNRTCRNVKVDDSYSLTLRKGDIEDDVSVSEIEFMACELGETYPQCTQRENA